MRRLWIVAILLSSVLVAKQGFDAPTFDFYDSDGDGKITKAELEDGRQNRMRQHAEEGRRLRNARNAPLFSEMDTNGDGTISPKELSAHQEAQRKK